jgi:carbon-monoxide dehydrogenase medium subunit
VQKAAPALAEAAGMIGDPAVRSRGTIGGNIAHADPASDLPTVLVALDARIVVVGPSGERTIVADGFFTGIMTTTLADNEVVTAIVVPVAARGQGSAYVKFSHPASRYAVIGVAASLTVANNQCSAARVALGGLLPHARRAAAVEKALGGKGLDAAAIAAAAGQAGSDLGGEVNGDIFASASYRKAVAPVYVKRAIAAAAARAGLA